MQVFLKSSVVAECYKQSKYSEFIGFLQNHCREEMLEEHFAKDAAVGQLETATRGFVISLFIQRQDYARAYALMQQYYGLQVDERLLLQMCNEQILATEFERDDFLLALCGYLLQKEMCIRDRYLLALEQVFQDLWVFLESRQRVCSLQMNSLQEITL